MDQSAPRPEQSPAPYISQEPNPFLHTLFVSQELLNDTLIYLCPEDLDLDVF